MKKNRNQNGFAHITILTAVVLVMAAVSFAGFRVIKSNNSAKPNSTQAIPIKLEGTKKTDLMEQKSASTRNTSKTTSTIYFTKGGGSLEGVTVKVSLTTTNPQTGTCTYSFTLGNSKVQKTNSIVNSKTCVINIPLSAFPKNGNWYFELSFASNGGKLTGKGGGFVISIDPQPRTITFTKGGGGQSGDLVVVSGTLSESQTGTCTYKFSLNGTVRVEKTNTISSSKTCGISIPVSNFPKSASYSFSLSFVSSTGLVEANQSPYSIDVM